MMKRALIALAAVAAGLGAVSALPHGVEGASGTTQKVTRAQVVWRATGMLTVSSQPGKSAPYLNSASADRPVEPTHFSPLYVDPKLANKPLNNYIRGITWESWGGAEAVGHGQVTLLNGTIETSPVIVRLDGLSQCAGLSVYTSYSLELGPGAAEPSEWPVGQSGSFPCEIGIAAPAQPGTYIPGQFHRGCSLEGLNVDQLDREGNPGGGGPPPWWPALPHYLGLNPSTHPGENQLCMLRWSDWGSAVAKGTGVRVDMGRSHSDRRYWPARLTLRDPVWCPAAGQEDPGFAAITYGELRVTLFGQPRFGDPTRGTIPLRAPRELSGKRRTYSQRIDATPARCFLGYSESSPIWPLPSPEKKTASALRLVKGSVQGRNTQVWIESSPSLEGHAASVTVSADRRVCGKERMKPAPGCVWQREPGSTAVNQVVLSGPKTTVVVPTPKSGERVHVRIAVKGFTSESGDVEGAGASLLLR